MHLEVTQVETTHRTLLNMVAEHEDSTSDSRGKVLQRVNYLVTSANKEFIFDFFSTCIQKIFLPTRRNQYHIRNDTM